MVDNSSNSIIGIVSFDNHPAISTGMVDFMHSNHWEHWLEKLFKIDSFIEISSYNTLWMNYFYIDI
jgi:hypothetical protein